MNWLISFSRTTADCVFLDRIARLQHLFVAAGIEADVLLAEQAGGQDRGERIFRKR
jgi:hypothetical protein